MNQRDIEKMLVDIFREEGWKVAVEPMWGSHKLSFDLIAENQMVIAFVEIAPTLAEADKTLEKQHSELDSLEHTIAFGPKETELYLLKLVLEDESWSEKIKDRIESDLYVARKFVWRVDDLLKEDGKDLNEAIKKRLAFLLPFRARAITADCEIPEKQVIRRLLDTGITNVQAFSLLGGLSEPVGKCNCDAVFNEVLGNETS